MPDGALTHEPWIRATVFVATCVVLLAAEALAPRRPRRPHPWPNWWLLLTDTAVVRLVSASSVVGVAAWVETRHWGILNAVSLSAASAFVLGFVWLDLGLYLQHRALHRFAWLWRLHRVHHSDTDFHCSTGVRFHPGEILFSFAWKAAMVIALGAAPWTVLAFEASLSTASLFTHANFRLPVRVDTVLRRLVVTPESIGLGQFRESAQQRLGALLVQPFAAESSVQ